MPMPTPEMLRAISESYRHNKATEALSKASPTEIIATARRKADSLRKQIAALQKELADWESIAGTG